MTGIRRRDVLASLGVMSLGAVGVALGESARPGIAGAAATPTMGRVSIVAFGANPAKMDNSAAIQAAIDTGLAVYVPGLPSGSYWKYNTTLQLRRGTVLIGDGLTSRLHYTGGGDAAISDATYGPADSAYLGHFELSCSNSAAANGVHVTSVFLLTLDHVRIAGLFPPPSPQSPSSMSFFNQAGLYLHGDNLRAMGTRPNCAVVRILSCDINGCAGDGVLIRDDAGAGGIYLFHNQIQGNFGIGVNQVFGINVNTPAQPGYNKSQVHVICNDIEGNQKGQVNCDVLLASVFQGNHLENSVGQKISPMIFGGRQALTGTWGQHFGLSVLGNFINGRTADSLIQFPSPVGSTGIAVVGNQFDSPVDLNDPKDPGPANPTGAVFLDAHSNVEISGNSALGPWVGREWAFKETNGATFQGHDKPGHEYRGELRYPPVNVTSSSLPTLSDTDYNFLASSSAPLSLTLPTGRVGKRVFVKDVGTSTVTLSQPGALIDGLPSYSLTPNAFVELESDGVNWLVVRK